MRVSRMGDRGELVEPNGLSATVIGAEFSADRRGTTTPVAVRNKIRTYWW